MSLTTRIIIFVVAVVAFVAAILATAARAQYAQDSWYEPPTKITVKMHRVITIMPVPAQSVFLHHQQSRLLDTAARCRAEQGVRLSRRAPTLSLPRNFIRSS